MTGVECVEGMASGLYEELFAAVVSLINRYQRAAGHWGWGWQPLLQGHGEGGWFLLEKQAAV